MSANFIWASFLYVSGQHVLQFSDMKVFKPYLSSSFWDAQLPIFHFLFYKDRNHKTGICWTFQQPNDSCLHSLLPWPLITEEDMPSACLETVSSPAFSKCWFSHRMTPSCSLSTRAISSALKHAQASLNLTNKHNKTLKWNNPFSWPRFYLQLLLYLSTSFYSKTSWVLYAHCHHLLISLSLLTYTDLGSSLMTPFKQLLLRSPLCP